MNAIRLRLRNGDLEIEVEGPRKDVDELLSQFWPHHSHSPTSETPASTGGSRRINNASPTTESPEDEFNPAEIANRIREHPLHQAIETEILHKRDIFNKCALVLWATGYPLTSGEIAKVLENLDVRAHLPNISEAIKRNTSQLTKSTARKQGSVPRYKLTSKARSDFEASFNK